VEKTVKNVNNAELINSKISFLSTEQKNLILNENIKERVFNFCELILNYKSIDEIPLDIKEYDLTLLNYIITGNWKFINLTCNQIDLKFLDFYKVISSYSHLNIL
jgi:hypothetical protein